MTEETSTEVLVEDGFNEAVHEEPAHVETILFEVVTNEILAEDVAQDVPEISEGNESAVVHDQAPDRWQY
ncbi:hypothetical protein V6N12_062214 [Hibiscus sabdariffa]|uniref:Uncharacterized protein n=1 Tax=Hibiscus sabdariffa TaxID=183260 RepID=A0ABR2F8C0_9ROSI